MSGPADEPLLEALRRAEPRGPRGLARRDPGAALALAAHCLMLDAGFKVSIPAGAVPPPTRHAPAGGWDKQFEDEWVFDYVHPEKGGRFTLHCSLQRVSGRMLVSALEAGAPRNHHMLGLQLSNYVPGGPETLDAPEWSGIIVRQGPMSQMFKEHVVGPLLAMATEPPGPTPSGPLMMASMDDGGAGAWWGASAGRRYTLVAAGVLAAAVVAGVAVAALRSRRPGGVLRPFWA